MRVIFEVYQNKCPIIAFIIPKSLTIHQGGIPQSDPTYRTWLYSKICALGGRRNLLCLKMKHMGKNSVHHDSLARVTKQCLADPASR